MTEPQPWTVLRLINWTRDYLEKANIEHARLAGEVLLAHALGCKRIQLYTRYDYEPTPDELARFRELVRRAREFEPVAYMVGEKEFYSLRFKVTRDVLVPRGETEALVSEALTHLKTLAEPLTVWDACTGSGCVAIAIAVHNKQAQVLATDISEPAVAIAGENAQAHDVAGRVRCRVADLLTLPDDCRDLAPFAVITGNPPYISTNQGISETVQHEPPVALWGGADGLDLMRRVVADAPALLRPGGALVLEFGYAQEDAVRDLIVATGEFREPRILKDYQEIDRNAVAIRK